MQKYFISTEELNNLRITSSDVFHIKNVTRSKLGDTFIVSDNLKECLVKITAINKNDVAFEIVEYLENNNELPVNVTIFQGYPKGDKMEDIIKHGTELGASSFVATFMKRSIVKLDDGKINVKTARFSKIAKEAAEQSFRKMVPSVSIKKLKEIDFSSYKCKLLCYEEDAKNNELKNFKTALGNLSSNDSVAVLIGPEGGIDEAELAYLKGLGFISVALGPRILRTETASMYVLSSISYELELKK